MSLLNEILVWSRKELRPWQSDAVRRLFQQENLSTDDIKDLYALLKAEHGIPDPSHRKPVPFDQQHLPVSNANALIVTMLAMRDLKHVNAIAGGQTLSFSPKGMTVIYGGNGSGKSGYSRVLKRACRARDQEEKVLPNAMTGKPLHGLPEAWFEINVNGKTISLNWRNDAPSPEQLSAISVFDARCARLYIDEEQDVAFVPYGLDVLENLARHVLPKLSELLNSELAQTRVDFSAFNDLLGATEVGKAIEALPRGGNAQRIADLGAVSDADKERLMSLEKTLSETDPKAKALTLTLVFQRISGLVKRTDEATKIVDDSAVSSLRKIDDETEDALMAQHAAAEAFRAGEMLLPGTGESAWRLLFEAARRFSAEFAYPGEDFPVPHEDAKCPLCQDKLSTDAKMRLRRFDEFVKQDVARVASEKARIRKEKLSWLTQQSVSLGIDNAFAEELSHHAPALLSTVLVYQQYLRNRYVWLTNAIQTHSWEGIPELIESPIEELDELCAGLRTEIAALNMAANEVNRQALVKERDELSARLRLSSRVDVICEKINKHALYRKLQACEKYLKTRPISDKSKQLSQVAVTAALKAALDKEFAELGVGHLKTALKDRTEAGKTKHKLVLDLPAAARINEILSEGEQRAIAIGAFLAEMRLSRHTGGIVFDDPVSSLDHYRRKQVAKRLVAEAKNRQVIVFTHDTTFLGELRDAIEQSPIPHVIHHLRWESGMAGVVQDGLPWEHQSYRARIDQLEKLQRQLHRSWSSYPGDKESAEMRRAYSELRATIERIIQDVVFNGVVERYRDWIKVSKLEKVVGFDMDEYREIARLHQICCDVTEAHDPCSIKYPSVPSPTALAKDIADLQVLLEKIRGRQKQVVKATNVATASP